MITGDRASVAAAVKSQVGLRGTTLALSVHEKSKEISSITHVSYAVTYDQSHTTTIVEFVYPFSWPTPICVLTS